VRICHVTPHLPPDQAANALLPYHLGCWARDAGDDVSFDPTSAFEFVDHGRHRCRRDPEMLDQSVRPGGMVALLHQKAKRREFVLAQSQGPSCTGQHV
jgi:hypothetical protein